MTFYSNSTTDRLEARSRALGINVGVVISPGNARGRYFVVRYGAEVLHHWGSLGWTVSEAKESLEQRLGERPSAS